MRRRLDEWVASLMTDLRTTNPAPANNAASLTVTGVPLTVIAYGFVLVFGAPYLEMVGTCVGVHPNRGGRGEIAAYDDLTRGAQARASLAGVIGSSSPVTTA